jgi:potassium-transporting ATPase potassium-binding subunit
MTVYGLLQILLFALLMTALARPLGGYLQRVFAGKRTIPSWFLGSIESALYRLAGVDRTVEQTWFAYTVAVLTFNLVGFLLLYALLRLQGLLPLNPQHLGSVAPDLALNTSISFVTNTSWQSYAGETTLGTLTQMAGITVQSFLSAATGISVAIALVRGFARRSSGTIGNFWVDLTRANLYVLLPISVLGSLFFVWQGVPQTLAGSVDVTTLEGSRQVIARGPVASQLAIKMLSSDGGGFFNANSAHPFENPTPITNLVEIMLIFVIGIALTNTFGRMVGDERQGWALLATMAVLFAAVVIMIYAAEAQSNPFLTAVGIDQVPATGRPSGNMEGKEVRFGIAGSSLFAAVTTASSSGAVNSMHDSFMPLGGAVLMMNMMLDEVIVGGVGSGLYGILLYCIVTVFVAGLMIGRTPEYVGKKIEATEVKLTVLALLCVPAATLGLTAVAVVIKSGIAGRTNAGPHGFSEILYAYTSATATNGSAFAGLNTNTAFYNLTLSLAMFIGRFFVIIPVLAIAGALAAKRLVPRSAGTLPTRSGTFVGLLTAIILLVGGLTFFPAIVLGPVAEHLAMQAGTAF